MKVFEFKSHDNEMVSMYLWSDIKGEKKGVVQILHGMCEHMERYDDFAKMLNANGYVVLGEDHRGHGKTAGSVEKLGKIGLGDMFTKTLKDAIFITRYAKEVYKDLPYIVIGHSYGSLLLQRYLEFNSRNIDCAILLGTSCLKGSMDVFLGSIVTRFADKNKPATLLRKMSFDKYNKAFPNEHWISRDKAVVDTYLSDEYCNQTVSNGFYKFLFAGVKAANRKNELAKINEKLPILIASGTQDKFTKDGKLSKKLYDLYTQKVKLEKVELKLYEGARHELLNETNKEEVYNDILQFISKSI